MRIKNIPYVFFTLSCLISFIACGEDDASDKVETITMFVSEQTGTYQPWSAPEPIECMLAKEENDSEYFSLGFGGITGFKYERGCRYQLLVEKTTLANPPMDAGNIRYKLLEMVKREIIDTYYTVELRYGIDAEQEEPIEDDLRKNLPLPDGGAYVMNPNNSTVSIVDKNKKVVASGELHIEAFPEGKTFPESYMLVVPDNQILTQNKWRIAFEGTTIEYDVFYEEYGIQVFSNVRFLLYKDLTEHYKQKYPDAGVRGVVCVQILTYKPLYR